MRLGARDDGGHRGARICGLGTYRPARVVGNDEVAARVGVSAEWIRKRSGIRDRRYAGPDETLAMMGVAAGSKGLAMAGVHPDELDCVLVATTTHLTQMPALAPEVAAGLGARYAAGFDLSAACAGFCHCLALANDLVRAGTADHVLVLAVERLTDILDQEDPTTAFLFADGAGAVVVGPSETIQIGPVAWGSDGSKRDLIGMTGYWTRDLRAAHDAPWPVLRINGWRVFRWASEELAAVARTAARRAGLNLAELDVFIPHQANLLITEVLARELALPNRVVVARDVVNSGNTSAASIPLAMEQLMSDGQAHQGSRALLLGFGSGMVYAAQVVTLP